MAKPRERALCSHHGFRDELELFVRVGERVQMFVLKVVAGNRPTQRANFDTARRKVGFGFAEVRQSPGSRGQVLKRHLQLKLSRHVTSSEVVVLSSGEQRIDLAIKQVGGPHHKLSTRLVSITLS